MGQYNSIRKEELRIMGFQEYRRRPDATIMAKEVRGAPIACATKHGEVRAEPGQFVVEQPDGEQYPISAEDLERAYMLVEGDVEPDEVETGPVGFPAEVGIMQPAAETDG